MKQEQLTEFLGEFDPSYMKRTNVKGPDFLIDDNFVENFELEKADLVNARKEAEIISTYVCSQILANQEEPSARCDNLTWLKGIESDVGVKEVVAFKKIADKMKKFIPVLNAITQ